MKSNLAVLAALFVALCGVPRAGQPTGPVPSGPITVMTWNVYHGVDTQIMAVGQATSQADLCRKSLRSTMGISKVASPIAPQYLPQKCTAHVPI